MLKTSYILAWILVALSAVVSLSSGYFDSATQVAFSVAVLALVYALALWSVLTSSPDARRETFCEIDQLNLKGGKQ